MNVFGKHCIYCCVLLTFFQSVDETYDKAMTSYCQPYHFFVDKLVRVGLNQDRVSESCISLSKFEVQNIMRTKSRLEHYKIRTRDCRKQFLEFSTAAYSSIDSFFFFFFKQHKRKHVTKQTKRK